MTQNGYSTIADYALSIKQNWTKEQAIHDLERLILRGERPADKVVGMAIKALEKQIPQKAVNIIINQLGIKIGICPRCNDSFKVENVSYCSNCGQALDWSDLK